MDFDRAVSRYGAHLRKTAAEAHDGRADSEIARPVPGSSGPAESVDPVRTRHDPKRRAKDRVPVASSGHAKGKAPSISAVLRDIRRCQKALENTGLRKVITVDIHHDQGFYLGILWAMDPYTGKWRVFHENTWDVQVLAPESGDYAWTRKSEVRPLMECSAFQQVNAHAYLDALLGKATGAATAKDKE